MSIEVLAKLFSSATLVKIMRLFLFAETPLDIDDVMTRTKSKRDKARYELRVLEDIGFLKKRIFYKTPVLKRKTKKAPKKKKVNGWALDEKFSYLPQLRALLVNKQLLDKKSMKTKMQRVGKVKLVLASGAFVQEPDARLDLLVVADKVKPAALHSVVSDLEALIGSELRYTLLGGEDFKYRMSVRDRLLRDVFDFPYTTVINTYKNLSLPTDASLK